MKSTRTGITIDQIKKCKEMQEFDISKFMGLETLPEEGTTVLQQQVGQLGWLCQQTRPDLAFENLSLSTRQKCATYAELKEANKVIKRSRDFQLQLRYNRGRSNIKDWTMYVYADAAFALLDQKTKSSEGRFIFLVNEKTKDCHVLNWKAAVIHKVCSDVKTAETLAMQNAMSEAIYLRDILKQVIGFELRIKVFTDSKSLKETLQSTTLVENRTMRLSIASMKQWITEGTIHQVFWVPTKRQVADVLTKKGVCTDLVYDILHKGKLPDFLLAQQGCFD